MKKKKNESVREFEARKEALRKMKDEQMSNAILASMADKVNRATDPEEIKKLEERYNKFKKALN